MTQVSRPDQSAQVSLNVVKRVVLVRTRKTDSNQRGIYKGKRGKNCKRFPTRPKKFLHCCVVPFKRKMLTNIRRGPACMRCVYAIPKEKPSWRSCVRIVSHRSVRKIRGKSKKLASLKLTTHRKCFKVLLYLMVYMRLAGGEFGDPRVAQSMQNAECPLGMNAAKVRSIKECQSKVDACVHSGRCCPVF